MPSLEDYYRHDLCCPGENGMFFFWSFLSKEWAEVKFRCYRGNHVPIAWTQCKEAAVKDWQGLCLFLVWFVFWIRNIVKILQKPRKNLINHIRYSFWQDMFEVIKNCLLFHWLHKIKMFWTFILYGNLPSSFV